MSVNLIISHEHAYLKLDSGVQIAQLKQKKLCFIDEYLDAENSIRFGYYIGIDWMEENKTAFYVQPKLDSDADQTNYISMLFSCMRNRDVFPHTKGLFSIDFGKPSIEIATSQDLLTPLLVVQYLQLLRQVVRKGLKKSYFQKEENLYGNIKGKVLVAKSIKQNVFKNRMLRTYCSHEEFGFNCLENRLLKQALIFAQRYLNFWKIPEITDSLNELLNYILPAFEMVSDEISVGEIKQFKTNPFYKEYAEAIWLAKIILRKYGYNIKNVNQNDRTRVSPFWIDMAKLFELYVLSLLKNKFGSSVKYHLYKTGNELDYLLSDDEYQMVIDAKYKPVYENGFSIDDVRQVSGYARLNEVYKLLGKNENEVIDCLIIYPSFNGNQGLENNLTEIKIPHFCKFYKYPIALPTI